MVSFLSVSTLLERKALKLSKWACTRVTEWEEIRSVVSAHYTCALSFPKHQIRSRMFPDQRPKKVYVGKWRIHVHEAVQGFLRSPAPVQID